MRATLENSQSVIGLVSHTTTHLVMAIGSFTLATRAFFQGASKINAFWLSRNFDFWLLATSITEISVSVPLFVGSVLMIVIMIRKIMEALSDKLVQPAHWKWFPRWLCD